MDKVLKCPNKPLSFTMFQRSIIFYLRLQTRQSVCKNQNFAVSNGKSLFIEALPFFEQTSKENPLCQPC